MGSDTQFQMPMAMEPLEGRAMLSATLPGPQPAMPEVVVQQESADPLAGSWNQGDFYYSRERKFKLRRVSDRMLIGMKMGTNVGDFARKLTAPGGPLEGFKLVARPWDEVMDFWGPQLGRKAFVQALRQVRKMQEVSWAAPTFINVENGLRMAAGNRIAVKLKPEVKEAEFFGSNFRDPELFGPFRQYVFTIRAGGVPALRLANRLQLTDSRVEYASVDFWAEAKLD